MANGKDGERQLSNSEIWDRIDEAHPELREQAKIEAAADAKKFGPMHSPDEITGFVHRNYPELSNERQIAIGILGRFYRVSVIDRFHVNHTLKIDPKDVTAYLAQQKLSAKTPRVRKPRTTEAAAASEAVSRRVKQGQSVRTGRSRND
jgi:hypothetical protein